MKRFLSWIVLILCAAAACLFVTLMLMLMNFLFSFLSGLGLIGKIVGYIVVSGILAWTVFTLFSSAPMLTVRLSDRVSKTRRGTRYIFIGSVMCLLAIYDMLAGFRIADLLAILYAVALLIGGCGIRKNSKEK